MRLVEVSPEEVKKYAARGDPPMDRWPGSTVTRPQILAAGGDDRDWFHPGWRLGAAEEAWAEFVDARRRRRTLMADFDWNQVLIIGDYGVGKTTVATLIALHYFTRGHAVFSNASCLFGWRLGQVEMYTAMGFMPKCSLLLIDESSAALASRVGHGLAISSFVEMNLNVRKLRSQVMYMSAQDWQIAPSVRRDCKEVWMPVGKDSLEVDDGGGGGGSSNGRVSAANDFRNFRLAWHVWDDYPYRKANLIEGPDRTKEGFGPPSYTMFAEGEEVRRAFLLNDTFELAQAGAATMATADTIKPGLSAFLEGRSTPNANGNGADGDPNESFRMLQYFESREDDHPEYFTASEIGRALGVDASVAGKLVHSIFRVKNTQRKGYKAESIYRFLDTFEE